MRIRSSALLLTILIGITGCSKDSNPEPDAPGSITITIPGTGNIYDNGFPLKVEGEMSDNNVIGVAKVEIRNKSNNNLLNSQTTTLGAVGFYRFSWTWNVTGITSITTAIVRVFNVDKLGNQVTKDVEVTLNP